MFRFRICQHHVAFGYLLFLLRVCVCVGGDYWDHSNIKGSVLVTVSPLMSSVTWKWPMGCQEIPCWIWTSVTDLTHLDQSGAWIVLVFATIQRRNKVLTKSSDATQLIVWFKLLPMRHVSKCRLVLAPSPSPSAPEPKQRKLEVHVEN